MESPRGKVDKLPLGRDPRVLTLLLRGSPRAYPGFKEQGEWYFRILRGQTSFLVWWLVYYSTLFVVQSWKLCQYLICFKLFKCVGFIQDHPEVGAGATSILESTLSQPNFMQLVQKLLDYVRLFWRQYLKSRHLKSFIEVSLMYTTILCRWLLFIEGYYSLVWVSDRNFCVHRRWMWSYFRCHKNVVYTRESMCNHVTQERYIYKFLDATF